MEHLKPYDCGVLVKSKLEAWFQAGKKKAHFCEETGIPLGTLKHWLAGKAIPVKALGAIAKGLETTPAELIKPAGVVATPAPLSPTMEALTKVIQDQERRIRELEAKEEPRPIPTADKDALPAGEISAWIKARAKLPDDVLETVIANADDDLLWSKIRSFALAKKLVARDAANGAMTKARKKQA